MRRRISPPRGTPTLLSHAASRRGTSARTTSWRFRRDVETFSEAEVERLLAAFHDQHEARFGFRLPDHIEIVNFLVTGIAKHRAVAAFRKLVSASGPAVPTSQRPVWFANGWLDTPVYARADLREGHAIPGPALVEESASVTVLDPGKKLTVDRYGNLVDRELSGGKESDQWTWFR